MLRESLDTKADWHNHTRGYAMKRRDFIKVTGIGVAGAATNCRAGDCAIDAGTQMAHDDKLA